MNSASKGSSRLNPPAGSPCFREKITSLFRKLLILVPLGIMGNVAYCLVTADKQMLASVVHFHPGYLLGAALLSVVPWFTGSLRLFTWTRFLGRPVRYRDAFGIAVSADLGAAIAPPMIGGGAVKIGMLMNAGVGTGTALSLPVLENLEDVLFFLIMVPLALTISSSWALPDFNGMIGIPQVWWLPVAGFASLSVALLVLARYGREQAWLRTVTKKIKDTFRTFLETFRLVGRGGKKVLILTLFLTAVQWICRYSIISLLLAGLDLPVRPVLFMVLQVFVFALVTLVPSPGGAGGAEIIFSLLYSPFLPAGSVGLVTTVWRFFTFYLHTLLAALLSLVFGLAQTEQGTKGPSAVTAADSSGPLLLKEEPGFAGE